MAEPTGSGGAAGATEKLLDLKTLVERPTIGIDGERYEILSPDELSVVDHHWLTSRVRRIDELLRLPAGEFPEAELTDRVHEVSEMILVGVPAAVRDELSGIHRVRVIEVFTMLSSPKRLEPAMAALAAALAGLSTGATSPPGSNGSTAATPTGGSAAPRSPSSGPTSP